MLRNHSVGTVSLWGRWLRRRFVVWLNFLLRWYMQCQLSSTVLVAFLACSPIVNTLHKHPDHSPLHPQAQAPPSETELPGYDASTVELVATQTKSPWSKLSGTYARLGCTLRRQAKQIRFWTGAVLRWALPVDGWYGTRVEYNHNRKRFQRKSQSRSKRGRTTLYREWRKKIATKSKDKVCRAVIEPVTPSLNRTPLWVAIYIIIKSFH